MSFIGSLFGGGSGAGFQAKSANLLNPTTVAQSDQTFGGAQNALQQQQAFLQQLQAQNGVGNQNLAFQNASNLANGVGPNPAQAQLAQATQANTANQAALMAGQRGASANPALIARLAAQQGSANQQNAAGQAATLAAQQQLAGQQQMANIAGQQVGNLAQGNLAQNQLAQNLYGQVSGNINNQNQAAIGNASQQNSANASIAGQNAQTQRGILSGLAGGLGTAVMGPLGGLASSAFSNMFSPTPDYTPGGGQIKPMPGMAHGGEIKAANGPRSNVGLHFMNMQTGGHVPGKAAVKGDSAKNDTVPAMLSPGEVVIPKHIMEGKNPSKDAAKFVAAVMAKKGKR